jgi:hypothetical protein
MREKLGASYYRLGARVIWDFVVARKRMQYHCRLSENYVYRLATRGKTLSFVTELRSPETSIYATFVSTPRQDSFYFGRGRKNHAGVNCVAYKHNSPDIKNVQPHSPPLPFVWCVTSVPARVFSQIKELVRC